MKSVESSLSISMLAAVPYHFHLPSRSQRLAWHLAARGVQVRYVAPPTPRAMLRHWVAPWRDRRVGAIDLVWPLPAPPLRWQEALRITRGLGRCQAWWIGTALQTHGPHVLCVSSPVWVPLLPFWPAQRVVYDCLDDPLVHARRSTGDLYAAWHRQLCQRADLIVAVSEPLAESLRRLTSSPVVLCGNGVDAQFFARDTDAPACSLPSDCAVPPALDQWVSWRRAHPEAAVAGFVGSIERWVDTEMLAQVAEALPQVHFVMAGPVRHAALVGALAGRPNVRLLGWLPYAAVPALIGTFDVCLIPFRPGVISASADPLKVYEYCALGKPVLSSVRLGLDDPDAPLIVAEGAGAFAAAIEHVLRHDDRAQQAARIAFARRHTWEARAEKFLAALQKTLSSEAV